MINIAQKPGLFAYWVTHTNYERLSGHVVSVNYDLQGPVRYQTANLVGLWELSFIKIYIDGDHLCALVGDNLQEGVAEFAPFDPAGHLLDQVTDLFHAYRKAHPEGACRDRCVYWEPHEIQMMSAQARKQAA